MASTVYDKKLNSIIKLDYRVIEERNNNSETSDWLEYRFDDVDRHFLFNQSYLEMDVQIVRRNADDNGWIPMFSNEPVSIIPNGWARFKRAQILMQDRIVADIEIDNTVCQNILTLPKYGTNHNKNLLDSMDFNVDEMHEYPYVRNIKKPVICTATKTTVVANTSTTFTINVNDNPEFLVGYLNNTNTTPNTDNIITASQGLTDMTYGNQFQNWFINILPTSTTHVDDIGRSAPISTITGTGDSFIITINIGLQTTNNVTGYKISLTPPDNPYSTIAYYKTAHQKRFEKYRMSRINKLILPLSESNIGIGLCDYDSLLNGIKWTLRLQKANSNDILISHRGITVRHEYLIRNSRLNVAVLSDSVMKSTNYEAISKNLKSTSLIDFKVPVLFSRENTQATNVFWTKDFSLVEPPSGCFVCFKNGSEDFNRNRSYVNPSFFDDCDVREINIKINGKRLEDPNLSVRFTEVKVGSQATNTGDSSSVQNLYIAYRRFLDSYHRFDDFDSSSPLLTTDMYNQLYPIFYFDLKGVGSTLFTGVGSTMSLSVEYTLNTGIRHVVYVIVIVNKKLKIDTISGIASIEVSS